MNKNFIYCESTDGGMDIDKYSFKEDVDKFGCFGWMLDSVKEEDQNLLDWANNCEIGDYFEHRVGICIRVN